MEHLVVFLYNVGTLKICMKEFGSEKIIFDKMTALYSPQTLFVMGILFICCPCVRPSVRPSIMFCYLLNILKSHC